MSATVTAPPAQQTPAENMRGSERRRPRNRNRNANAPSAPETTREAAQGGPAPQPQRGGGGGRGRGRGRGQHDGADSIRPGTAAMGATTSAPEAQSQSGRGHRARGGYRGSQRARGQMVAPGGRQFGGQLTENNQPSALQADAPAFQPGQPIAPRPAQRRLHANHGKARQEDAPRGPKSTAQDIATRTHEDIDNGHYECAVCYESVKRRQKVWSCRTCWTVFHLHCIKQWSTKEGAAAARQQAPEGELPPLRQWRCPGCNLPKDALPRDFWCWCEKEMDPKPLAGLPPYSCGQTCFRPRTLPKKCPHPCTSTCHAGPCPPCTLMGPVQYCFCGKSSVTRRCVDTDYDHGWSCGDICGELMPCGEHYCPLPCHEGLCGACEVRVPARCYCGQIQKDILCADLGDELESSQSHTAADGAEVVEHWTGLFECPNTCSRPFDCGKHKCEKSCHQQDAGLTHCPRSPDVVSLCPCGKTPLSEISDRPRLTCNDPIPNCSKPCRKSLACGHECTQVCHQGECMPCLKITSISCRCGRTTSSTICHQGTDEPPQCLRVCRVTLNCGRHECGDRCCAGERKAAERQSNRRKPRPLTSAPRQPEEGYEAEHICTRSCGRQLKCGNPDHRCQELCHKGPCGTCREAIFDEVSCHCGRTVLQPPLPCGTKPPPCRFNCERPKACGHPQVAHNCHQDDESCPNCPFLTTKPCLCGKNTLKNQPCWLGEVRCGGICGKRLKCGAHTCQKQCHRLGECEEPCGQLCGKELTVCGHPCMSSCHAPTPCKEEKPCQHRILVTCECQRIKQEAKCNASKNSEGNLKKALKCDEECARLERNRKLAVALNIDPATHQDDHIPYSAGTMKMYQEHSTWAAVQEKAFRLFAANVEEKRLRFKPMPANQRAFIHSIAEDFGFDSESLDPEPHRHVSIFKTPRFVMAPMKTLAECARIRAVQRVSAPQSTVSTLPSRPKPSNISTDPYNAFLITNPRFALTIEDVGSVVRSTLPKTSFPIELEIHFLPSEEVILRPPLMTRVNMLDQELQSRLESIKSALSQAIASQQIGKLQLVRVDASLNVLRKESDTGPGSGWSQVAAKGGPIRKVDKPTSFGTKGGFAVLSLSSTRKKKEKEKAAEVVDDWEAAEMEEEQKEEQASRANSAVVSARASMDAERPNSDALGIDEAHEATSAVELTTRPTPIAWADLDDE
jgi:transcriptional repressor NF-X1